MATAIPKITDQFGLRDVAWYSSGFFMTTAGFQSSWGKIYRYFPLKIGFLSALGYVMLVRRVQTLLYRESIIPVDGIILTPELVGSPGLL